VTATFTITAVPVVVNLVLYQGDDFFVDLTVTNPDGSAADLTGVIAQAQIRAAPGAPDILASFTTSITTNVIHLHLPHTEAEKLSLNNCAWDCQIVGLNVTTLTAGYVAVMPEVTV
jgi:hypothetical protein